MGVAGVEPALTLHTLEVVYAHAPTDHSVCSNQTFVPIMDIPIVWIEGMWWDSNTHLNVWLPFTPRILYIVAEHLHSYLLAPSRLEFARCVILCIRSSYWCTCTARNAVSPQCQWTINTFRFRSWRESHSCRQDDLLFPLVYVAKVFVILVSLENLYYNLNQYCNRCDYN